MAAASESHVIHEMPCTACEPASVSVQCSASTGAQSTTPRIARRRHGGRVLGGRVRLALGLDGVRRGRLRLGRVAGIGDRAGDAGEVAVSAVEADRRAATREVDGHVADAVDRAGDLLDVRDAAGAVHAAHVQRAFGLGRVRHLRSDDSERKRPRVATRGRSFHFATRERVAFTSCSARRSSR